MTIPHSVSDQGDRRLGFNLKCARCLLYDCKPDQRRAILLSQFDRSEVDTSPLDAVTIWHGEALCREDLQTALKEFIDEQKWQKEETRIWHGMGGRS